MVILSLSPGFTTRPPAAQSEKRAPGGSLILTFCRVVRFVHTASVGWKPCAMLPTERSSAMLPEMADPW